MYISGFQVAGVSAAAVYFSVVQQFLNPIHTEFLLFMQSQEVLSLWFKILMNTITIFKMALMIQ